ncbi:Na/Pi cotransporter family protein [Iocasia frigidifontis]|uniref:Na/Pi cotransporter family protein n=1 Tax=Iocasia fonsfrigidae TaxID=2682810 RepID=A0A8A7KDI4_9FIRM|nr:Na/Pi cotransporter family protein [Iocasia fonsfrigidae]MTI59838.1 Na/Pi cotransporter family protein [Bacillota bacterium]QTL99481.1 Na/Pi cotransporter family protein [Iocasia fonsfrigidae]
MSLSMLFGLFGGLGLFIYGMKQMSEGLQKAAGRKLKHLLGLLTNNRFAGLAVGTLVTAVVQSSSATTVMVVGFVNAGLMTLAQSIGVIMGANIGTTITAQLIAFKLSHYSLHAIAIGTGLYLFSKKDRSKQFGQIILGFGVIFLGLSIMKDTMEPLKDSEVFVHMMGNFGKSPLLGLLLGTGVTIVLQSSSASMGILMSLLSVGIIDYWSAVPILLGENIGTTITAILSSVGANLTAKRAAAAHFVFNFLGASVIILLFYLIPNFANVIHNIVHSISSMFIVDVTAERLLANTHTFFNVINTLVWIPFVGFMVNLVKRIIPGEETSIKRGLTFLDERMLETPSFAIDQLKSEVLRMYKITNDMVDEAIMAFKDTNDDLVKAVRNKEEIINELEEDLVTFLTRFPRNTMAEADVKTVDMYYAMIDDIESIADDAFDVVELAVFKKDNKISFSDEAWETLNDNFAFINNLMEDGHQLIDKKDLSLIDKIIKGEEKMDRLLLEHRSGHMKRLGYGICDPNAGIVYLEVLDELEHISDQLADISHSITEARTNKIL